MLLRITKMKLSIIIPAYNAETTLQKCLDSVLAQTVEDYEILVINDGSKDSTEKILQEYSLNYPEKLIFRTVENGGQGRARNIALELSRGEWLGFVDSDDWVDPDMFRRMLETADRENSDLVICDAMAHFPDGSTAQEETSRPGIPMASAGFANNKLFQRELLNNIRFPEGLWYEDAEFTAKAIHRARHISMLREMLYHYRRGFPSTMNNNNARKNLDILTIMDHLEKEFGTGDRDDYEFLLINHVLLDAMNRVNSMKDAENQKQVMSKLRNYVREKIPHLNKSKSFRRESGSRRLIMGLHYIGFSDLAKILILIKGSLSRKQ